MEEGDDPPRCVRWILGQPPRKRAEALGLCEGAWGALASQSSGEELHKMQGMGAALLREFEERRSGDLADIEMLRRQLEESRGERLKLVEGMQESVEEEATRRGEAAGELHRLEFEASQAKSKLEMDRLSHQNQQFQVQLESQQQQQRQREEAVEELY